MFVIVLLMSSCTPKSAIPTIDQTEECYIFTDDDISTVNIKYYFYWVGDVKFKTRSKAVLIIVSDSSTVTYKVRCSQMTAISKLPTSSL